MICLHVDERKEKSDRMIKRLQDRQIDVSLIDSKKMQAYWESCRLRTIDLSTTMEFDLPPQDHSAMQHLDVDVLYGRYLLACQRSGRIIIYDMYKCKSFIKPSDSVVQDDNQDDLNGDAAGAGIEDPRLEHQVPMIGQIPGSHAKSVSSVCWYPVDNGLFTSSSYDKTVKVWDTSTLQEAADFNLGHRVHAQAFSPVAKQHSLLACGIALPTVVLCDLRSGASSHILVGHRADVMAVKWSPTEEYLLATGSVDSTIRLWDIRQAKSCLVCLDMMNSVYADRSRGEAAGMASDNPSLSGYGKQTVFSHKGTVNGLMFDESGRWLVSTGTDKRIRIWDLVTAKNMSINFDAQGIRNSSQFTVTMAMSLNKFMIADRGCVDNGPLLLHPNENGLIGVFDMWSGRLVKKLTGHYGKSTCVVRNPLKNEFYSCSADGAILAWNCDQPQTAEDSFGDESDLDDEWD